jgi:sporulation protein YlmC with PRC-barrel domain
MSTRTFAGVLLTVGLLCAAGLAAGQAAQEKQPETAAPSQAMPSQMPPAGQALTLVRAHELIGKEVKNTQGEDLGKIRDLVLTPDYQHVSYVALSSDGKLYAIPWQALKVGPKGQITMSATKEQFKTAPGFTHNNWPSQGNSHWLTSAAAGQTTTGESTARPSTAAESTAPSAAPSAAGNMAVQARRVTHLTGTEVKNPEGQDIGDIEDFAINTADGRVIYDIISFGGVAGVGERYAAVPPASVRIQPQTHTAILNATRQTLDAVAFKPSEFPNLGSREYMQRIYSTFRPAPGGAALGYVPPAPSAGGDPNRAWMPEGAFSKAFNPSNVKTVTGTIQSVGMFLPENAPAGTTAGLRLRVKTADGNFVTVFAGPIWYAEQKDFYLMPGDQVSITGSESKIKNRTVMVASEIKKGTETLELRDRSGKPLWPAGGPGATGMAPGRAPAGPAGQTRP